MRERDEINNRERLSEREREERGREERERERVRDKENIVIP